MQLNLPEQVEIDSTDAQQALCIKKSRRTGSLLMTQQFMFVVIAGQVIAAPLDAICVEQNGTVTIPTDQ